MCPDRDLVSAYVDGEVPSPWRERLEEHLASCPGCAELASRYALLGRRLRDDPLEDEALRIERGRARLDALLGGLPVSAQRPGASRKAWPRVVSLPLPLALAAAALVLLLGGATTFLALRPANGAEVRAIASGQIAPLAVPASVQPSSMEELLRYLNAQGGEATLTIKLPSEATFGSAGNPVIMRSTQVVRGTTVGGSSP
jgi:anti-sigma factor RsiW